MRKLFVVCCAWIAAGLSMSFSYAAHADDLAYATRVEGMASFELRHTLVLLELDSHPQSQAYWSVVIHSGPYLYEVDQPFAVGSEVQPDSVVLAGVVVRPGSRVSLEGTIDPVTRDYAVISGVHDVNLVMDYVSKSAQYFGWSCHSSTPSLDGSGRQVHTYVDVWLANEDVPDGNYRLRVMTDAGTPDPNLLREIAYIDHVNLDARGDQIIFGGTSSSVSAQLTIDSSDARLNDLPSTLRLSRIYVGFDENFPLETVVPLQCSRTRL